MKKFKNNLDEMQEQELLKIEHNGFWIAFWMLIAAMAIQMLTYDNYTEALKANAGEWITFMVLCIYLTGACEKRGIWDRRLKMNNKSNLIVSLIAGAVMCIFNFAYCFIRYGKPVGSIAAGLFMGSIVFIACFGLLSLMMRSVKKKQEQLEKEPEETE